MMCMHSCLLAFSCLFIIISAIHASRRMYNRRTVLASLLFITHQIDRLCLPAAARAVPIYMRGMSALD